MLEQTVLTATEALDSYDALRAGSTIERFVDQLSNWYVRRNRRRFWKAAGGQNKQSAYNTLYECLEVVNRLMAPFMPFLSEHIHHSLASGLTADAPESVHMTGWPTHHPDRLDQTLLSEMEVVQRVVTLGRAARNDANLKVRQPLARLLARVPDVSDRIWLHIEGNETVMAALDGHRNYIMAETLASQWMQLPHSEGFCIEHSLGSAHWIVRLDRDGSS